MAYNKFLEFALWVCFALMVFTTIIGWVGMAIQSFRPESTPTPSKIILENHTYWKLPQCGGNYTIEHDPECPYCKKQAESKQAGGK